jgi:hypothetical protein
MGEPVEESAGQSFRAEDPVHSWNGRSMCLASHWQRTGFCNIAAIKEPSQSWQTTLGL